MAIISMSLLSIQFALQPSLTSTYIPRTNGPSRSSIVLATEAIKFFLSLTMLYLTTSPNQFKSTLRNWTFTSYLRIAAFPAVIYAIQNFFSLTAYQNLDAVTFNTLNQTKTISAALWCFILLNQRQTLVQFLSLVLLLGSALLIEGTILEAQPSPDFSIFDSSRLMFGVIPCLIASLLSGLAGAISQKNLQGTGGRNSYLFSMEISSISCLSLVFSMIASEDGKDALTNGLFNNWSLTTLLPIVR